MNLVPNAQVCVFEGIVWKLYVRFVADIDIKILGVPLLEVRHAFPRQQHMRKGGLFIFARVFFPLWCHPWMDEWMDESREKASRKTTTTSFTICNNMISTSPKFQLVWLHCITHMDGYKCIDVMQRCHVCSRDTWGAFTLGVKYSLVLSSPLPPS